MEGNRLSPVGHLEKNGCEKRKHKVTTMISERVSCLRSGEHWHFLSKGGPNSLPHKLGMLNQISP